MSSSDKIKCPNCATEIDVSEVISSQVEAEMRQKYMVALNKEKAVLQAEMDKVKKQERILEERKKHEDELMQETLQK